MCADSFSVSVVCVCVLSLFRTPHLTDIIKAIANMIQLSVFVFLSVCVCMSYTRVYFEGLQHCKWAKFRTTKMVHFWLLRNEMVSVILPLFSIGLCVCVRRMVFHQAIWVSETSSRANIKPRSGGRRKSAKTFKMPALNRWFRLRYFAWYVLRCRYITTDVSVCAAKTKPFKL